MEKRQGRSRRVNCDVTYAVKRCSPTICVHVNGTCPCKVSSEYQCSDGKCIPDGYQCDGTKHCLSGEDEFECPTSQPLVSSFQQDGLSVTLVVTIATMCTFICVLAVIGLCILRTQRRKTNTSRDSQSVSEPLRKSYITSDTDTSPSEYSELCKPRRTTFYRKCDEINDDVRNGDNFKNRETAFQSQSSHKEDNATQLNVNTTTLKPSNLENKHIEQIRNISEEEDVDSELNGKPKPRETLGKYTFKPRLKYTNCNQILDVDKTEREKLYVINSYKHCSGKSILPTTLNFDKDPEQFSSKFANELLCSSTPRPPVKHLALDILSKSIESIDCDV